MKKAVRKTIEISFLGVMFLLTSFGVMAQWDEVSETPETIAPGSSRLNPALINIGNFKWKTYVKDQFMYVTVQRSDQELTYEELTTKEGEEVSKHTSVMNAKTLEMIRESYSSKGSYQYQLAYSGSRVRGTYVNLKTNTKGSIDEVWNGKYFAKSQIGIILSALPLKLGYRATLSFASFDEKWKPVYYSYKLKEVSENYYNSCILGRSNVWTALVKEESQDRKWTIYVDKTTRRIIRQDIEKGASFIHTFDLEQDKDVIKTQFNADEAMAMLTGGNSTVQGQAWTTNGDPSVLSVLRKKQFAPKGSVVILLPITPYHDEWNSYNEKISKNGCHYPMPKKVREASLVTDVTDDKGNFTFQGLKPGKYVAIVTFVATKYSHTTRTPNGVEVTVYGDGSSSSQTTYDVRNWTSTGDVYNARYVTIKQDGETVKMKLDK